MESRATAMMEELTGFSTEPNEEAMMNRGPKPACSGLGPARRDRASGVDGSGERTEITLTSMPPVPACSKTAVFLVPDPW